MRRAAAIYLGAALLAAWALAALACWAVIHVGARDDPEEWDR